MGHEQVRDTIKAHLAATVPPILAAIRAAQSVSTPPAPDSYVLADSLSIQGTYPVILVRSTDAKRELGQGDDAIWAYQVEVVVACEIRTAGAYEAASRDRDRLMLAVRDALQTPADLGGVQLQTAGMSEETGPAAETLSGRPMAAGTVKLTARAVETRTVLGTIPLITGADAQVTPKPANTETL